jgi:hypothetical protein
MRRGILQVASTSVIVIGVLAIVSLIFVWEGVVLIALGVLLRSWAKE